MLLNTGTEIVTSANGLLTTVCYRIGDQPAVYALEGSVAVSGSLVQWLRDNLGLISSAPEVETLAKTVPDNGGTYVVPAFSGLFAPYWRPDARGVIVGLTRFVNKGHIARAALESTAYQSLDVLEAMNADSGVALRELKVDGGMTANDTLMQFQADLLGVDVMRPVVAETTALGAAYAAGWQWATGRAPTTSSPTGRKQAMVADDGCGHPRAVAARMGQGRRADPRLGRRRRRAPEGQAIPEAFRQRPAQPRAGERSITSAPSRWSRRSCASGASSSPARR
jgi:glycerol kinase